MNTPSKTSPSLAEEISKKLRDAIVRGYLRPGERIVESRVAKENGVSQAPVREALSRLKEESLIFSVRHKGTFVSEFSAQDIHDLYAFRQVLDQFALKRVLRHIAETDLEHLEELCKNIECAGLANDRVKVVTADMEFHDYIYSLAKHEFLYYTWGMLRNKISQAIYWLNEMVYSDLTQVAARHKPIVDALRSRDPERINQANNFHLEHVRNLLRRLSEAPDDFYDAHLTESKGHNDVHDRHHRG